MKLFNIKNIDGFFEAVDKCSGQVWLVTNEGDRLNLKSKLSQFISLAELFSSGHKVPELDVICSEPGDYDKLLQFIATENDPEKQKGVWN